MMISMTMIQSNTTIIGQDFAFYCDGFFLEFNREYRYRNFNNFGMRAPAKSFLGEKFVIFLL